MHRDEIRKAVDALYTTRLTNEAEGCLRSFADDATFALAGSKELRGLGPPVRGKKALQPFLAQLVGTWRWTAHEPIAVLIDGQSAAVRYRLSATHVPSGKAVVTEIMDHIVFDENARIREMVQFVDTAAIERLSKG
jgi:ketosteroid isomerase-like protein